MKNGNKSSLTLYFAWEIGIKIIGEISIKLGEMTNFCQFKYFYQILKKKFGKICWYFIKISLNFKKLFERANLSIHLVTVSLWYTKY
jgi:hypothetical protein